MEKLSLLGKVLIGQSLCCYASQTPAEFCETVAAVGIWAICRVHIFMCFFSPVVQLYHSSTAGVLYMESEGEVRYLKFRNMSAHSLTLNCTY